MNFVKVQLSQRIIISFDVDMRLHTTRAWTYKSDHRLWASTKTINTNSAADN